MKKNKKAEEPVSEKETSSSNIVRNISLLILILVTLSVVAFFIWKEFLLQRELEFVQTRVAPLPTLTQQESAILANVTALQGQVDVLLTRVQKLEATGAQQREKAQMPHKMVAVELLRSVLDGVVPLPEFKAYLQRSPEPWAQFLLATLAPIQQSYTYAQLGRFLAPSPASSSSSFRERVLNALMSLVQVRKLTQGEKDKVARGETLLQVEDIRNSLGAADTQTLLSLFEALSDQDKAEFAAFKAATLDRLALENALKTLLEALMKG